MGNPVYFVGDYVQCCLLLGVFPDMGMLKIRFFFLVNVEAILFCCASYSSMLHLDEFSDKIEEY